MWRSESDAMADESSGPIVNCHTHVFTIDHVPRKFLPLGLPVAMRSAAIRGAMTTLARAAWPFSNKDQLNRLARFIDCTFGRSQADLFDELAAFYPRDTRFIVLSMDMAFMGAGEPPVDLPAQLADLAALKRKHGDRILPFIAVDPRRPEVMDLVREHIEEHDFAGIKLYPPLGFWPQDPRLDEVYAYAAERGVPILTHCARGGVYFKGDLTRAMRTPPGAPEPLPAAPNRDFTDHFAAPEHFRPVLQRHLCLRICFAHYGSTIDWTNYLAEPWRHSDEAKAGNWIHDIHRLMREHEGVYTDISYTLVEERIIPLLKVFLHNPLHRSRCLFGTDFYMLERDGSEREVAIRFRYRIGEEIFRALAIENPPRFLGEPP
jgi:predicted TIM-barrel fold metal-dependent hydrolase